MSFEKNLYESLNGDDSITEKAIANFMFREIIEDAHAKYSISQEDVRDMCRECVNRAAVLIEVMKDLKLQKAFTLYGYGTASWDKPDEEEVQRLLGTLRESADHIG